MNLQEYRAAMIELQERRKEQEDRRVEKALEVIQNSTYFKEGDDLMKKILTCPSTYGYIVSAITFLDIEGATYEEWISSSKGGNSTKAIVLEYYNSTIRVDQKQDPTEGTITDTTGEHYICAILDMYRVEGVQISFGLNLVGAPAQWSAFVPHKLTNELLMDNFDMDIHTLIDCVESGELTQEEAEQRLMEAIGDNIIIEQLSPVTCLL